MKLVNSRVGGQTFNFRVYAFIEPTSLWVGEIHSLLDSIPALMLIVLCRQLTTVISAGGLGYHTVCCTIWIDKMCAANPLSNEMEVHNDLSTVVVSDHQF
jgi:hypothetical protein